MIGRPPKFDYDGDEFYDEVFALAMQGATDTEIAIGLGDRLGKSLTPDVFMLMKRGKYTGWTKEENEKYGARLSQVLTRARSRINTLVRAKYLKSALGGIIVKSVSTTKRHLRVNGTLTDNEEIQTTTTEAETAPNMQALATWLYHHDKEWRKIQRGLDVMDENVPEAEKGIAIQKWIDQEVQQKE